jgi:tetratricopeptide (TPR) repeat protein
MPMPSGHVFSSMPDAREILDEGLRYERSGLVDAALERYWSAADVATNSALVVEAFMRLTDAYRVRCQWDRAIGSARRAAELARESGLTAQLAEVLNAEAIVHQARADFAAAEPLLKEVLTLTNDERLCGIALQNLGSIAAQRREFEAAEARFEQSRQHFRRAGYQRGEAIALANGAAVALDRGDALLAESLAAQAVTIARQLGDYDLLGVATLNFAEALARLQRYTEAEDQASTALGYFAVAENSLRRIEALRLLAFLYREQKDDVTARRCYEQALGFARKIDAKQQVEELTAIIEGLNGEER